MQLPENVAPVPHHPAYLVHPDGRVYSLRKYGWLSEQGKGRRAHLRRVRLGRVTLRVRDLVALTYGTTSAFEDRVRGESA